jgi:hypothetical protein
MEQKRLIRNRCNNDLKKKLLSLSIITLSVIFSTPCSSQSGRKDQKDLNPKITFVEDIANKRIDVVTGGKLFTSYIWPDNICKPVLYPVFTSAGTEITRGFPIKPKKGERTDHPHQIGMWLTYGNVDGADFWGNGSRGLGTTNTNGGVIKHLRVKKLSGGVGEGIMITVESWTDKSGNELLSEKTEYHFIARGSTRIIDRITTLTAGKKEVTMPDTKEGMFAIRVARELELPSREKTTFYSADGHPTEVDGLSNEKVSGNYRSSEGISGTNVWGTRAKWMDLYGTIGNEKISVVICDHPGNPNYPTFWHARDYGLFSANPLGSNDFTNGKEQLNFNISAGQSVTFRYRVIIAESHLNDNEINTYSGDFALKYK